MKDLQERLERLRLDAIDCDLIAKLATDDEKRTTFKMLATQYRTMADEIEKAIAHRIDKQVHAITNPPPISRRQAS